MLANLHETIVAQHAFLEALANLATVFALLVPLPVFVVSTLRHRRAERRERAMAAIERLDSGESRALRDRVIKTTRKYDLAAPDAEEKMEADELADLLQFMNEHELIGLHLNSSRIDRKTFMRFGRTAYARDWERVKPLVEQLRESSGPSLYEEWERAAKREL
jgi:uncharacterized protein DUF4760